MWEERWVVSPTRRTASWVPLGLPRSHRDFLLQPPPWPWERPWVGAEGLTPPGGSGLGGPDPPSRQVAPARAPLVWSDGVVGLPAWAGARARDGVGGRDGNGDWDKDKGQVEGRCGGLLG